ncbi:MAG: hypothetical protein ABIH85_07780 [Candidatus Omnitrophota bacterium]
MEKIKIEEQNLYYSPRKDMTYRIRGFEDIILSHLRVNVKATYCEDFFIDIVDLYSQKSRTNFLKKMCKNLGIKQEDVRKDIYKIIDVIERYQSDKNKPVKKETIKIGNKDREKALKDLKSPKLLNNILKDIEMLGYVGEDNNKIIAYLVSISRKLEDPLSSIVISESSAGKSALSEVVEKLTPPEDIVYFSTITPKALYYMDKDDLKHKFVIIEEREGSADSDYPIRILQSKKRLIQAVAVKDPNTNKTRTCKVEVEGPISYLETTTKSRINYENSTRCFELYLDGSESQTSRIHNLQKQMKTLSGLEIKSSHNEIIQKHHTMQRVLRPIRIVNPYSNYITFPTRQLRTRRDHMRFLNLIESVTFLHQYQRPIKKSHKGIEYIESALTDYKIAFNLYKDILKNTLSDIKKPQKELLDKILEMVEHNGTCVFTRKDVREYSGYAHYKVRDIIKELEDLEYLLIDSGSKGKQYKYRLNIQTTREDSLLSGITKPEELEEYICSTS